MPDEDAKHAILNEIRRMADRDGKTPGKARFEQETGIAVSKWIGRIWVNWGDAVTEAGLTPNELTTAYPTDQLCEALIPLVRKFQRYPVNNEIKLASRQHDDFPSHGVFGRLGRNKKARIENLLEWCRSRNGLDDVVQILDGQLRESAQRSESHTSLIAGDSAVATDGEVYLFRSGKYYKIGYSRDAGMRRGQLAVQMPEEIEIVHVIQTDDPVGIERYWHDRFADKRKNGEWFDLDHDDIRCFKRRKRFM